MIGDIIDALIISVFLIVIIIYYYDKKSKEHRHSLDRISRKAKSKFVHENNYRIKTDDKKNCDECIWKYITDSKAIKKSDGSYDVLFSCVRLDEKPNDQVVRNYQIKSGDKFNKICNSDFYSCLML